MSAHKRLRYLASIFCLTSQGVWANDAISEQDYLQDFPVVLSASRLSQPLSEAPNAMTVIDRKMIVASGFRSLPDLFNLVPGMYVSYYKGSQPIVSYHGSFDQFARSMQVMIDGRSVYMPPASTVDWASLPIVIDDIERIEVIRGPAAASYGANSVHGVINIITRDAGSVNGTTVSLTRGNKGVNDVSGRFGKHGKDLDYRMTLAYTADNGYDDRTPAHLPSVYARQMNNTNDSNQARLMNYRATYFPNSGNDLDVQLGYNRDVQGVGFWDSRGQRNPLHDLTGNAGFQQLTWLHHLDDLSEFSARLAHTRNDTRENFIVPVVGVPVSKSLRAERSELELQHTLAVTAVNRLVYGLDISNEQVASNVNIPLMNPNSFANRRNVQSTRLFAHDEWRFTPSLIVNTGAMFENDGQGAKKLSPRASLNYHLTPRHTLRIGASVAYRTPSLVENYGVSAINYQIGDRLFAGNTSLNLTPEKMFSREIGYLAELDDWSTTVDVRAFRDQFGNAVFYDSLASTFKNGMSGAYHGVESTIKHAFGPSANVTLNYAHEQAYSNAAALLGGGPDLLAISTPTNTVSLMYSQTLANDVSYSLSYYQQGAMQPFDRGIIDFQNLRRRTDIRVAKAFKDIAGVNGDVAWVVQNLFKDNYTEYVATNVFDRRTYVTLTVHW